MITLYCFHSPMISSVGFQRAVWKYENGQCQELKWKETQELPWKALCGSGATALCLDTDATRLFMVRDITATAEDGNGWRLNFLMETDEQDHAVLPRMLAALLKDKEAFCTRFASLFSVKYEGGEHYVLDTDGFVRLVEELRGEDLGQTLQQIPSLELRKRLEKGMPEDFVLNPQRLHMLVPSVTDSYFYQYTELKIKGKAAVFVGLETWNALLSHTVTENWTESTVDSSNNSRRTSTDGISDEDMKNLLLLLGVAVIAIGALTWNKRRNRNK